MNPFSDPLQLLHRDAWAIISAENPEGQQWSDEGNQARTAALRRELERQGLNHLPVEGTYGGVHERSFAVTGISTAAALDLAKRFKQECILTSDGLVRPDGTLLAKATGVTVFDAPPADDYSRVLGRFFRIELEL